jgi:hypothetical protein
MSIGIFESNTDVGAAAVQLPGSAEFDAAAGTYKLSGSGENMWFTTDAFHYLWTQVSGDVSLTADVSFVGAGKNAHRKACLVIRQSLEADAAYADAALHGDGLTSLQFRDAAGATTHEVQANVTGPVRLRIEKRGKYVLLYVAAAAGEALAFSGAQAQVMFSEPFYVGLGVCSHDAGVVEQAVFSNVTLRPIEAPAEAGSVLYSALETQVIASTDRRVCHVTTRHIEAPNWMPDGEALLVNGGGRLLRIPVSGGDAEIVDTDFAIRCNNDHGISPDGTRIVISDQSQERGQSLIYTLPIAGGAPTRITSDGPSYWHGWSPDGATLTYCAQRDGAYGIFTIPAEGGEETRLTTAENGGLDDGPEYSPDGAHIYFNSDRTGRMQIWRMRADGSDLEQITTDAYNNWFAHPSPDGKKIVFLSYEPDVTGHPPNKDVTLRLMTLDDRGITVLGRFFGGQGTINVPCWSPDGKRIAFVTYQRLH